MVNLERARDLCLSLPGVNEYDHFEKPAYRVKKKIFATLWMDEKRAVVKLSKTDQLQFCEEYHPTIFPVKDAWGKFGWTNIDLGKINEDALKKLLKSAWINVAPKSLSKNISSHSFFTINTLKTKEQKK